nr:hypothetical protein [Tanacetum cinerariifolium]
MMHIDRFRGQQSKKLRRLKVGLPFLKTARMESGAGDEDYIQRAMIHYEIDTGIPFKLYHCWKILKDCPKWQEIALPKFSTGSEGSKRHKLFGSSSFNTKSWEASINLNTNVGDNDEDDVQEVQRPEGRDKARAAEKKKGSKASGSSTVMRMYWLGKEYERELFKVGEVGVVLVGGGKGGEGGRP